MERNSKKMLLMTFDLNTLDHLGVKLYSQIPPMIAELVSNSWDADANNVTIYFNDTKEKEIIVKDNGTGMTFDELNDCFLKIGRNRRVETKESHTPNGRPILGKKGLGKLSMFGIGKQITITTVKNGIKNEFMMNYNDIKQCNDGTYHPNLNLVDQPTSDPQGTTIQIQDISRTTPFNPEGIAIDLSKRFTIFSDDFKVEIHHNNSNIITVNNDLYHETKSQFNWNFPEDFSTIDSKLYQFANDRGIIGKIFTSHTPISVGNQGIVLFSRGKLVQENNKFHKRGNDNFFSYMSGYFNIDFIDEKNDEDYSSTDRKSLAWDAPDNDQLVILQELLETVVNKVQSEWRKKRDNVRKEEIKDIGLDVPTWLNSLSPVEKPLAQKLTDAIIKNDSIDAGDAKEYIGYVQDMFSYESFKEFTLQLDQLSVLSDERAIKLLTDWQLIEAKELAKIAEGRIRTIDQFEKYIRENASETKVIQKFLEEFPWLLDPKMSTFEREVSYSKLLKAKFPDEKLEESNRRIDFLCCNNSGVVHIIELKRPNIRIGRNEILQADDYRTYFFSLYKEDVKEINSILISNNINLAPEAESMYESYKAGNKVSIKTYDDLLAQARRYHSEFIQRYKDIANIKEESTNN